MALILEGNHTGHRPHRPTATQANGYTDYSTLIEKTTTQVIFALILLIIGNPLLRLVVSLITGNPSLKSVVSLIIVNHPFVYATSSRGLEGRRGSGAHMAKLGRVEFG